jgi:putative transposase
MVPPKRFSGLKLTPQERATLRRLQGGGKQMTARVWRRIRVLLLLDEGNSVRATARAVGGFPREVSRVGKRYLALGLEAALSEERRPKPPRLLDSGQEAAVVAMVCGPAPEGRARWTVALVAEEAARRKVVPTVGRETIRLVLANHGLKPWREKNVVRPGDHR